MSTAHNGLKARAGIEVNQVIDFLERSFAGFARVGQPTAVALENGRCAYSSFSKNVPTKDRTTDQVMDEVNAALQNMAADLLAWRDQIIAKGGTELELLWRFTSKIALDHNMKDQMVMIRMRVAISTIQDRAYVKPLALQGERVLDVPHARLYSDGEIGRIRKGAVDSGRKLERDCWIRIWGTPFYLRYDQWLVRAWTRVFG